MKTTRKNRADATKPIEVSVWRKDRSKSLTTTTSDLREAFTKSLSDIYRGLVSSPDDSFCPLSDYNANRHVLVGTLIDPTARELYSFSYQLQEQARRIPFPRRPEEVKNYEAKIKILGEQEKMAMMLFWQQVLASIPASDVPDRPNQILKGWDVALLPEYHTEELAEMLSRFGLPPELHEKAATEGCRH